MVRYEDECVGCTSMGMRCLGSMCPNRNVPHLYCDECGEEDELYEYEGEQLCLHCIEERLEKVCV